MARRALLTDAEREALQNPESRDNPYVAVSRVRKKINEELTEDVRILDEHHEELLNELRDVVCEHRETAVSSEGVESPTADEPTASSGRTVRKEAPEPEPEAAVPPRPDDNSADLPSLEEIDDEVWSVVDEVAASWDDDERLQNRRAAAAATLQYAVDSGEGVGKSHDVVDRVRDVFPVESQNEETYWRKNIRDVLKEVGEYSRGAHVYTVESLAGKDAEDSDAPDEVGDAD